MADPLSLERLVELFEKGLNTFSNDYTQLKLQIEPPLDMEGAEIQIPDHMFKSKVKELIISYNVLNDFFSQILMNMGDIKINQHYKGRIKTTLESFEGLIRKLEQNKGSSKFAKAVYEGIPQDSNLFNFRDRAPYIVGNEFYLGTINITARDRKGYPSYFIGKSSTNDNSLILRLREIGNVIFNDDQTHDEFYVGGVRCPDLKSLTQNLVRLTPESLRQILKTKGIQMDLYGSMHDGKYSIRAEYIQLPN